MSDDPDRRAILARRVHLIAAALTGLGGSCTTQPKPQAPTKVAVLPVASGSASGPALQPPVDSDNEGVIDESDETMGRALPQPSTAVHQPVHNDQKILSKVYFQRFSRKVQPRSAQVLDEIANVLLAFPKLEIDVLGHCEQAEPRSIARQRAEAVRDALVSRGVEAERLRAQDGDCEAPSEDSRMVDFQILHERD